MGKKNFSSFSFIRTFLYSIYIFGHKESIKSEEDEEKKKSNLRDDLKKMKEWKGHEG